LRYATLALERFRASSHSLAADEGLFVAALAYGLHLNGRNREADSYFRQALQKFVDIGRGEGPNAINLRNSWAIMMDEAGMPGRALRLYDETLAIVKRRNPGSRPPSYLLGNRAMALENVGRFAEARAVYLQELEIGTAQDSLLVRSHALHGLASTAQEMGDRAAAEKYLDALSALLPPSLPESAPQRRSLATIRGLLYIDAGQFAAARAEFVRAIGSKSGTVIPFNAMLGKIEVELRTADNQAAADDARLAVNIATSARGDLPYSKNTGLASVMLARALRAQGAEGEARKALETALTHLSNTVDADHPALVQTRALLAAR
jgi:tetratricopeptide (TPR) repeat protein